MARGFPGKRAKPVKKSRLKAGLPAFEGDLDFIDTSRLFQIIENIQGTGKVELASDDELVDVYFDKGKLVFAETVHNKIKLGSLLIKKGLVTKEQAQEALDVFDEERGRRKIGEILIDLGYIEKKDLENAMLSQIKIAVASTLLWKSGTFVFIKDVAPPVDDLILDINVQLLIIEVLRRSDEKAAE